MENQVKQVTVNESRDSIRKVFREMASKEIKAALSQIKKGVFLF